MSTIRTSLYTNHSSLVVVSSRYTRAERDLRRARPFGEGSQQFFEKAEVAVPEKTEKKRLLIAITSDRGLCGAVHSGVARNIRNELIAEGEDTQTKIICVGDKSRAILQRLFAKNILFVGNEVGRLPPTFIDASKVATECMNSGYDYTDGKIVYNKFKTVVSYNLSDIPIFSRSTVETASALSVYDSLDADVIQNYLEFSLASLLFYAMKEGACSEQSSRMTSMDNASKNAGEMIDKLTLTFNRTRQSVITRELIEIISGASALEKEK